MNTSTASTYILSINENFPVAGQRNESQGFKNNFYNIKSALQTITATMQTISTQSIIQLQDNDVNGYSFKNLYIENGNVTAALQGDGTLPIDYSKANYWPVTFLDGGLNNLTVSNMPANSGTGVLVVGISTSSPGTTVLFTSDEATVVSLGPEDQPFKLGSSTPYFFKLWNDYTGDTPYIYVKKVSQDIIYPITSSTISSDTLFGVTAAFNTVTLKSLTYTIDTSGTIVVSGINETNTATGNFGLVPRITQSVVTGTIVGKAGGAANSIGVTDATGIYPGDRVRFIGTTSQYTVANIVGTLVNLTNPFDIGYANVGDTITFISNQFNQPTVMTMSDVASIDEYGTISTGSNYNLKGTVYADENNLQVAFADPGNNTANTLQLTISTTITNTTPTDIATIGIAHQWLPAGSIIMWTKSKNKIPYGWILCDGTVAPNGMTTPDLRNRFVYGADSELNSIPTATDRRNTQVTSGGTSTGVLITHSHTGTSTTVAISDPGHAHLHVGPSTTSTIGSSFPAQLDGLNTSQHPDHGTSTDDRYIGTPNRDHWGFITANTSTASQWMTSIDYTFQDQYGHNPDNGSGIEFQTTVTVFTSGTTSNYSNLPQYRSLYFIYKWLTA